MAAGASDVRDIISISFAYERDRQWFGWHGTCAGSGTIFSDVACQQQQQAQQQNRLEASESFIS